MSSKLMKIDTGYKKWVTEISQRFRSSQIKAALKVNQEMLRLYWEIGRDISAMHLEAKYGSSFYDSVSLDLKESLPGVHSFSPTNLKFMCYFYELFPDAENRSQVVNESVTAPNCPQVVNDLGSEVFSIPWGHYRLIISKCKGNKDQALFYVRKTIENGWSRAMLGNYMKAELYSSQGKAISNFSATLPSQVSGLAQEMTKDPYHFDFLSMRENYDEKELKDALMDNITRFLLELGSGFSFVGREVRLPVGEKEKFLDMLFFNIRLKCYVVLEVKTTDFDSSYAGQLGTYVVAVNHQLKEDWMNPTIGLLVCQGLDKVEAQYALESTREPIGVSGYQLSKLLPKEFKGSLPTIEEIEAEIMEKSQK